MISRLAIGTAQFGSNYGVANSTGMVNRDAIEAILAFARSVGINTLDTAVAYGCSESAIGLANHTDWEIVTKIPYLPLDETRPSAWLNNHVQGSLDRLKTKSLYALLLHNASDLLGKSGHKLYEEMIRQKEIGKTLKIGVSVYDPEILSECLERYSIDIVQLPINVLDRRFVNANLLGRLKHLGVEIHARSIFMQGLLLMAKTTRPNYFTKWNTLWETLEDWYSKERKTPLEACLAFALSFEEIDRVVIGIDSLRQLHEITNASRTAYLKSWPITNCNDAELLNPSYWNLK